MFLSGSSIEQAVRDGSLGIDPFDSSNLKEASYTFSLSSRILIPKEGSVLSLSPKPKYEEVPTGPSGFLLNPGSFVLGFTQEKLSLKNKYVCFLSTRGSCAQIGLNVMLGSNFAEPGTDNPQILEIHNVASSPIKLETGMKIVKGVFALVG